MGVNAVRAVSQAEVADAVRRAILAGDLVAGQRLVEAELTESLGASRGAVRGALIDLTHEGLVERIANRGARVRVVTVEEALQITEVRMAVEGLCGAKAAERITDAEIADLRELGELMRGCVDTGDVVGYSRLNQQLHESVIRIAAQPVAAEVISRLRARNVRHQFRLAYRPGRPQASLPQHLAIIEALAARDPEAAQAAVRAHISSVMDALRQSDHT
ncbi:DNA-binding transcriptional regulator, GntR family [Nocardioides terrae]|uniref:DNA-binding transcriptional regulator, GntR family n=1 Tax=Nocardioides terrae TaxID=574651 RepID=A0A1I1H8S0_9ACTN|nr:GntR family transcriptional regulator [Nocardioides terrae]SFC18428.1 DNA-binding transcriptional regulator, GntR family [Nocardioides terrae]